MKLRDGGDRAAVFHQLAEKCAEQKNREELREKLRRASHEGLRPVRKQRFARESRGDKGGSGCQQEHAPSLEREPYEQPEADQDADEDPSRHTPSSSVSRSKEDRWPKLFPSFSRKCLGRRRPSSRSMHRNSHSALSLEE